MINKKKAVLTAKGERWVRSGHPWIFRGDLALLEEPENGDVIPFYSPGGALLGWGFYSRLSRIVLRKIATGEAPPDDFWWRQAVEKALQLRRIYPDSADQAGRLIFSESDGLPGLIADWYAGHLVLQTMIPGMDRLLPPLAAFLQERLGPKSIFLRNDPEVRVLEQLPRESRLLYGNLPDQVEVGEGSIRYRVDIRAGQKTGGYLDQQENRKRLAAACRPGSRVLDCFCYNGIFALHLARIAGSVTAVDDSARAVEAAGENAGLNDLRTIHFIKANCFDFLKQAEKQGERYDLMVLDPPPFARKKSEVAGGQRGYLDLNRRALACLNPGGVLATFSCSHNIREELFQSILQEAAAKAKRRVFLLEKCLQAPDHPILLTFPESYYLKGLVLRVE